MVLSNSRGPETLTGLVSQLTAEHGGGARAGSTEEAAAADVVVVHGRRAAVRPRSVAPRGGLLAVHLSDSHVVTAVDTIHSDAIGALARPSESADRSALPIFGEDLAAMELATTVLDHLGFDVVDGGGLSESWRAENGRPAYAVPD